MELIECGDKTETKSTIKMTKIIEFCLSLQL